MGSLAKLVVLLSSVGFPSVTIADLPESLPQIISPTASGNGCPHNAKFYGGFNDLSSSYSTFNISIPDGSRTQNCQLHIQGTGGSPGWQVSVRDVWVKGHACLHPGTNLEYYTTVYYSQDASNTASRSRLSVKLRRFLANMILQFTFRNGLKNDEQNIIDDDVTLHSDFSGNQVWSQCFGDSGYTGILNVNFRGALSGDGAAYFDAWTQNWALDWRRC